MQFKIHGSFEVSLRKADVSRVQEVIQRAAIARLCCDMVLQRSNYGPPNLAEKDITQLTMLKMQYRHDHLLQLIGMFIMGDKRQWQGEWMKVRRTVSVRV